MDFVCFIQEPFLCFLIESAIERFYARILEKNHKDWSQFLNPLMPGGNKNVTHTLTNLQLNTQRSAADSFKYV